MTSLSLIVSRFKSKRKEGRNLLNNVGVLQLFQQRDLSDGGGRDSVYFLLKFDFLEGNVLSQKSVMIFLKKTLNSKYRISQGNEQFPLKKIEREDCSRPIASLGHSVSNPA